MATSGPTDFHQQGRPPEKSPRLVAELLPVRRGAQHGEAAGRGEKEVPQLRGTCGRGGRGRDLLFRENPWGNGGNSRGSFRGKSWEIMGQKLRDSCDFLWKK